MANCTLSKNKNYEVEKIIFNQTEKIYHVTLTNKPASCAGGIFSSRKLEVKIAANNKIPFLHFNKQDGVAELVVNNLSLINNTTSTVHPAPFQNKPQPVEHTSQSSFSFFYILLAVIAVIFIVRFIIKKKNQSQPYYPGSNSNAMLNSGQNNPNGPNYPNYPNAQGNNGFPNQGPSKAGSFFSGLAGGALGSIVGNSLYDKFKGSNEAQASQNPNPSPEQNESFSSDAPDDDSSSYNSDDYGSNDSSDSYFDE